MYGPPPARQTEGQGGIRWNISFIRRGPHHAPEQPEARGLLVRDGRIAAVGGRAEAEAGPAVRRVDLAGRTLLPGFLDAHSHFAAAADQFLRVSLADCASWDEIRDRIKDHIRREHTPADSG